MFWALAILWTVQAVVFSTAAIAVRTVSRTRLTEALKRIGREDRLAWFDQRQRTYALTALIARQSALILFVVTVGVLVRATDPWYWHPLTTLGVSFVWFVVFAIGIPAGCARYVGEGFLARFMSVLEWTRQACRPILTVIAGIDEIVRRLVGAPSEETDPAEHLEREILDAVAQAEDGGAVDESEMDMIRSVMNLDERRVAEVMTPRTDIVAVEADATYARVRDLVRSAGHSRVPVFEDTLDHIIGVLYVKDLLRVDDPAAFTLREMVRKVPLVPETRELDSLLKEFQSSRVHMAIVLDEYGGTAGLVTIEDILEELVGEIADEHEDAAPPLIHRLDARTVELDARLRVDEANEELELELPEDEAYDTVGGFVLSRLGRVPAAGEVVEHANVRMEIVEADSRSIKRMRLRIREPARED